MKQIVIPVAGFARSGKDTLANAIFDHLEQAEPNYSVLITKFADALKEDLNNAMHAAGLKQFNAFTEDPQEKALIRPLLVAYGEYRRALNPNVWVDLVLEEIRTWTEETIADSGSEGSVILVPDLRYANEYEKLEAVCQRKGWEFIPIYIERQFNGPANEAEATSIGVMATRGYFTRDNALQLSFGSGSVELINQWAKKFSKSLSVYR